MFCFLVFGCQYQYNRLPRKTCLYCMLNGTLNATDSLTDFVCRLLSDSIVELGHFVHPCEDDLVLKCTNEKIPYFNAPLYFQNKQQVGKVDEIFGPINDFVSFAEQCGVILH